MKKKLFTLLVCAFAVLSANAWTVNVSGTTVTIDCGDTGLPQNWTDFGDYCQSILDAETLIVTGNIGQYDLSSFDQGKSKTATNGNTGFQATTVNFADAYFIEKENGAGPFTFYEYAPNSSETPKYSPSTTEAGAYVQDDENGKYIEHANVYYKTNGMTFDAFANVTTPVLSNHVESICQDCIRNKSTLTTTFTIPGNIKFLATGAVDNTPITSLVIPSSVEYIQSGAVKNASTNALIDVTVQSISTVCAKNGFLKDITVGQTNAGYMNYAVLHFPEGAEEYFINETHPLSLEVSLNKGWFQQWLDQHYSNSGNGWQEFINSTPGEEREELDNPVVLRTFSDNVAHYVPLCYRAYIVNGIDGNSTDGYTLKLQETYAIPANTGVIIYGEAATGSFALPILSGSNWTTPYDRTEKTVTVDNKQINLQNFLVANCTLNGKKIGPYELSSDKQSVAERNFVMGRYAKTDLFKDKFPGTDPDDYSDDYIAFFRAKNMTPGSNKAHLKLPSSMFNEPKGAELIAVNPSDFRETEWIRKYKEFGDWGQKANGIAPFQAKSFGEPFEDEATGINNVKSENTDDVAIYNLQGVRVANPVKGVYVKAGKKIIIK